MPPEKVYEKLEETFTTLMCMAGETDNQFNESRLWEMIEIIKRIYPWMLQNDNSILKNQWIAAFVKASKALTTIVSNPFAASATFLSRAWRDKIKHHRH